MTRDARSGRAGFESRILSLTGEPTTVLSSTGERPGRCEMVLRNTGNVPLKLTFESHCSPATARLMVTIAVNASDYNQVTGQALTTVLDANSFLIRSNNSTWTLSVRAQSSTFAFVSSQGDANPGKSCGDLSIRENGTSSWLTVTTSSQFFASGPKGNFSAPPKQMGIDYRLSSQLRSDPPGTYSLTLIWTLTQPWSVS